MMVQAAAPHVGAVVDGDGKDDGDGVGVDEGAVGDVRQGPSAGGGTEDRQEAGRSDGGADTAEGSEGENSAGNGGS